MVGAVLCTIGCLTASLALTSYVPVAASHPVVTAKNVSRYCQAFPGGHVCPTWRTTKLVAPALGSTDNRLFTSSQMGDPLEKEMATHSSILAWRMPWIARLVGCSPWGHKETRQSDLSYIYTEHSVRQPDL